MKQQTLGEIRKSHHIYWWLEILVLTGFYFIYSYVRNFGEGNSEAAFSNANDIIRLEKWLNLFVEEKVQDFFIDNTAFIQFWNLYYGLFHFLFTLLLLIVIFVTKPAKYAYWRTVGLLSTTVALLGYWLYPLAPPRLMNCANESKLVSQSGCDPNLGFTDTVTEVGGIWSFEEGPISEITNQFAAMPSLHIGWSIWCALVAYYCIDNKIFKGLLIAHPFLTLFAITVTGNHWWLDALGGALVVAAGIVISNFIFGQSKYIVSTPLRGS